MMIPMNLQEEIMNYSLDELPAHSSPMNSNSANISLNSVKNSSKFQQLDLTENLNSSDSLENRHLNMQSQPQLNQQILQEQYDYGELCEDIKYEDTDLIQEGFVLSQHNDFPSDTKNRKNSLSEKNKLSVYRPNSNQSAEKLSSGPQGKHFEPVWSSTGVRRNELIEVTDARVDSEPKMPLQIRKTQALQKDRSKPENQWQHLKTNDSHLKHREFMKRKAEEEFKEQDVLAHRLGHLIRQREKQKSAYDFTESIPQTSSKKVVNLQSIESRLQRKFENVMDKVNDSKNTNEPIEDLNGYIQGQILQKRLTFTCFCGKEYFDKRVFNKHLAAAHPEAYETYKVRGSHRIQFNAMEQSQQSSDQIFTKVWYKDPLYLKEVKTNRMNYPADKIDSRFECICGKYFEQLRALKIHIGQVHNNLRGEAGTLVNFMVYPRKDSPHYPYKEFTSKYQCGCGGSYSCSSALNLHIRNKHGGVAPLRKEDTDQNSNQKLVAGSFKSKAREQSRKIEPYERTDLKMQNEEGEIKLEESQEFHDENLSIMNSQNQLKHKTGRHESGRGMKRIKRNDNSQYENQISPSGNSGWDNAQNGRTDAQQFDQDNEIKSIKSNFKLSPEEHRVFIKIQKRMNPNDQKEEIMLQDEIPNFLPEDTNSIKHLKASSGNGEGREFNKLIEKVKFEQIKQKMNHILFEKKLAYLKRLEREMEKCKLELSNYIKSTVKVEFNGQK